MHVYIYSLHVVRATVFFNRVWRFEVLSSLLWWFGSVNSHPLMFNRQPFCDG